VSGRSAAGTSRARRRPRDGRRCGDRLSLRAHWRRRYLGVDLFFVFRASSSPRCCSRSGTRARPSNWRLLGAPSAPAPAGLLVMLAAVALYVALDGRFGPPASSLVDLSGLRATALHVVLRRQLALDLRHQSYFAQFSAPSPSSTPGRSPSRSSSTLSGHWSSCPGERHPTHWRRAGIVFSVTGALASALAMALLYRPGTDPTMSISAPAHGRSTCWPARPSPCSALRAPCRGRGAPGAPRCRAAVSVLLAAAGCGRKRRRLPPGWMFREAFSPVRSCGGHRGRCAPGAIRRPRPRAVAPAIRWVGMISYASISGTAVEVFMSAPRTGLSGAPLDAARLAVTFAAATASFYVVERPVRAWLRPRGGRSRPSRWPQASWPRASSWARCGGGHEAGAPSTSPPPRSQHPRRSPAGGFADQQMIACHPGASERRRPAAHPVARRQRGPADRAALGAALPRPARPCCSTNPLAAGASPVAWVLSGGLSQLVRASTPTS